MSSLNAITDPEDYMRMISLDAPSRQQIKERGMFDGLGQATINMFEHTGDVAMMLGLQAAEEPVSSFMEGLNPDTTVRQWFDQQQEEVRRDLRESRPNPETMGVVAQGVQQLGTVALAATAGFLTPIPGGAAMAVSAVTGMDKYWELRDQGADHDSALKAAGITGTVMGLGTVAAPFYGSKLATQLATGIGINAGLGMAERGGISAVMESAGHTEIAKQYRALDGEALAIDSILGAGLVGVGRFMQRGRRIPNEDIDAAQAANLKLHQELNSAELATNQADLDIQSRNLIDATMQLYEGKRPQDLVLEKTSGEMVVNPKIAEDAIVVTRAMDEVITESQGRSLGEIVDDFTKADAALKEANDAIQKRGTEEVDVRQQAGDGEAVAARGAEAEAAATTKTEEKVIYSIPITKQTLRGSKLDDEIPVDFLAKHGDDQSSPWLLSDGTVIGTGQDHIGFASEFPGWDQKLGYSEFMKATGAVRASFFKDASGQYVASLHLANDQMLTPAQLSKLKQLQDAVAGEVTIMFGRADGLVNPEYQLRTVADLSADTAKVTRTSEAATARTAEEETRLKATQVMYDDGRGERMMTAKEASDHMQASIKNYQDFIKCIGG